MKVAILGVTGYTGLALLRILLRHPAVKSIIPVTSSQADTPIFDFDRGLSPEAADRFTLTSGLLVDIAAAETLAPDVVFAALPHLASAAACASFFGKSLVVDLSADFRIKDAALFARAYGRAPDRPDLLEKAVYGLAEWNTEAVRAADLISNPGCYPTATLLPLLPLARASLVSGLAVVNALSGISGAGRSAKVSMLFGERSENVNAYSPGTSHRHAMEIQHILDCGREPRHSEVEVLFNPHLVPIKQGMAVTTVVEAPREVDDAEVRAVFDNTYTGRPFVKLTGAILPETRDVRNSNRIDIGWRVEGRRVILFSVIDNLGKGASGQAVQNMNIRLGLEETSGLPVHGEF